MSVDPTKIRYSSTWDIDQLIATGEIAVGTAAIAIYTFTTSDPPYFEVQFKSTGSNLWFQPGVNSTNATNTFSFKTYINGSSIYIDVDPAVSGITGGTARYFIWSDKVNY